MHLKDSEKVIKEAMNKDRELQLKKANACACGRAAEITQVCHKHTNLTRLMLNQWVRKVVTSMVLQIDICRVKLRF
jgi:hypothetical protein